MIARNLFFICFLFFVVFAQGQVSFGEAVKQLMGKSEYAQASAGISVVDLSSGKELYARNAAKLLIPASTLKLITTATALELLGADYRFETKIAYRGIIDKNGVLHGDVILQGGADPALGSEYFSEYYNHFLQQWAQKIYDAGIKEVRGNMVLDASVYDGEKIPATWIWEDIGNYYGAGASAFTVYDNRFLITFCSQKKEGALTTVISTRPSIPGMTIKNEVRSASNNRDNAYVFGSPWDKKRVIRGTIPANRNAFTIKAAIHHPGEILAAAFVEALAHDSIAISGEVKFQKSTAKNVRTVFVQHSPPLSEIVKVTNHESVNLFAEHCLKQLAVVKYGQGSRKKGIEIVKNYWEEKGVLTKHIFLEDGSGLSHFNAVSPRFFTQLLTYEAKNKSFVKSLPCVGEGTLSGFDTNFFPGDTLRAKSGSMTRVRCYAGYITARSGKKIAFAFMFNHFSGSHYMLKKELEQLMLNLKKDN